MNEVAEAAIDSNRQTACKSVQMVNPVKQRLMVASCHHQPRGQSGADLAELERHLKVEITPVKIQIGRMTALNCGGGWLKIDLLYPDRETEAELLPPECAAELIRWLKR